MSFSQKNIKNKQVLVTGGSRGIGEQICLFLLENNYDVYAVARNNLKSVKLKKYLGKNFYFYKYNLLNDSQCKKFLLKLKKSNFDIIINNVGGGIGVRDIFSSINDWYSVWKFNVGIAIKVNNFFIRKMKLKKSGKIIHVSSSSSIDGGPAIHPFGGSPPYACAKAFLNMYVKTLGRELNKFNIHVSAILPGPILTENKHWDKLKKKNKKLFKKFIKEFVPTGKMLKVEEIIPVIKLLCDNKKVFPNSSLIRVDSRGKFKVI